MLHTEAKALEQYLRDDNLGLLLIAGLKELDFYYYNLLRSGGYTDTTAEHFDMLQLGIPRLIELSFKARNNFEVPIVTFRRTKRLATEVLKFVCHAGFIEARKRFAHATMAGECSILKLEENSCEFVLPANMENFDYYERSVSSYYQAESRKIRDRLFQTQQGKVINKKIDQLLNQNVYVWRDHFIGYTAHPMLDEYFAALAYSEIQLMDGFDSFHHALTFGGVSFMNYVLGATFNLALAMKHERFCEALLKKEPKIQLANILTISCEKQSFVEGIAYFIERFGPRFENFQPVTLDQAEQIYNLLSLRRENAGLLNSTAAPLSYIVEFSDTGLIKSVAGAQMAPMQFMLNSLRFTFPEDYNRNQQTRESSMQRAVKRVLNGTFDELEYRENIKIREGANIRTDIDLVAMEKSTGNIMLFQLKHQDPYGSDIRARSSRADRLKDESEKWIQNIQNWLDVSSREQILATLRLRKHERIGRIRIVVLTRHFAHFLSKICLPENVAVANWLQFYNSLEKVKQAQGDFKTLGGLFNIIHGDMIHLNAKPYEHDGIDEYNLNTLKFRIRQSNDESSAESGAAQT